MTSADQPPSHSDVHRSRSTPGKLVMGGPVIGIWLGRGWLWEDAVVLLTAYFCTADLCYRKNMTDDEFKRWLCSNGLTKEQDHRILFGKIHIAVPVATSLG